MNDTANALYHSDRVETKLWISFSPRRYRSL